MCETLIVWVDVETTGLELDDKLLEVGVVVTDDKGKIYREKSILLDSGTSVVQLYNNSPDRVALMHEKSGLWDDLQIASANNSLKTCSQADQELYEMLKDEIDKSITRNRVYGNNAQPENSRVEVWLGGNSVFLDRYHIKKHLPRFSSLISHRSIDMTSVSFFATRNLYVSGYYKKSEHRALSDAKDSLTEYIFMIDEVRGNY